MASENDLPATKRDIEELDRRLTSELHSRSTKMDAHLAALDGRLTEMEDRLVEKMRDMQTEVLRAFHNWARPAEIKMRSHEERLTLLEERLAELERGRSAN